MLKLALKENDNDIKFNQYRVAMLAKYLFSTDTSFYANLS
jgi:hypothetical protein